MAVDTARIDAHVAGFCRRNGLSRDDLFARTNRWAISHKRHRLMLELWAEGRSISAIARHMGLAPATVRNGMRSELHRLFRADQQRRAA